MSNKTGETAVRVRITGRVQGIGFRYWTIDQAIALGLRGWVRNRGDGSVEAVFGGAAVAVAEMVRRCHRGPSFAHVERVEQNPDPDTIGPGFHVMPTA